MILPIKVVAGLGLTLTLALGGVSYYAKQQTNKLAKAQTELGSLQLQVSIAEAQAQERQAANNRLEALLRRRVARAEKALAVSAALQEKINALTDSCTFSDGASRVLWEIYEHAGGVQGPVRRSSDASSTDPSAPSAD